MKRLLLILCVLGFAVQSWGQGCYFGSSGLPTHQLTKTSGNQQMNAINNREYELLVSIFGVRPDFYYLYDNGSPNAYATPQIANPYLPDGTIMLGFELIKTECANSPSGTCSSIPIILAHEFAHIIDFKYNMGLTGKYKELFADYVAGAYLFHRSSRFGYLNVTEVARSFFSKGGYDFNNPLHHGTPEQRLSSLNAGFTLAQQMSYSGQHLSMDILLNNAKQYVLQF